MLDKLNTHLEKSLGLFVLILLFATLLFMVDYIKSTGKILAKETEDAICYFRKYDSKMNCHFKSGLAVRN